MSAQATNTNGMAPYIETHHAALARTTAEPQSMAELKDFAKMAAASRFYGAETPEQALMIAMTGKDLGMSYSQALRAFHVISGKPTLSADGMVAVCTARPDICEYFKLVRANDTEAVWVTKRVGHDPVEYRFTMEEAKKAGLVKSGGMYDKHPRRMLSARAKAYLARDVYIDLLLGLIEEDEAREIAARREPPTVATVVAEVMPNVDLLAELATASTKAEMMALKGKVPDEAWNARRDELRAAAAAKATANPEDDGR